MMIIMVFFSLFVFIGIAELLRRKVTWFNQRPVFAYILALCLTPIGLLGGEDMAVDDMIALLFFISLVLWIGISEVLRWKFAWCKERPILTYFLVLLLVGNLSAASCTPEMDMAWHMMMLQ